MTDWFQVNEKLSKLAKRQIFFVGGAPRSGTTWLQQIIDQHPHASCRGEGLFSKDLFALFDDCMIKRRVSLEAKNKTVFSHTKGYPLPGDSDGGFLAATAMLLAFYQQAAGRDCLAYGEKTPENVFAFPQFKRLFPHSKLVAIARDPRDLLTSAWHFFRGKDGSIQNEDAKSAFVQSALPSINEGMRTILDHRSADPKSCHIVTYEQLQRASATHVAAIFSFLGIEATDSIVAACVNATRFEKLAGGRKPGDGVNGAFLRKGVVGDWQSTLTPAVNTLILQHLGWAFPEFGWTP